MKKVILTFGAATDPVALMSHLLGHRLEAVQLVLSQAAARVEYDYGGSEVYRNIDHDDFLEDVSRWNEFKDLGDRLVPSNLPLAIKLLRHALSEGLILKGEDESDSSQAVEVPLPRWGETEIGRQNGLFEYHGTHFIAPDAGVFEAKRIDVRNSIRSGHSLALDSLAPNSFWRTINGDERLVKTPPVLAEALSRTPGSTLDDYKFLVRKSSPAADFLKNYEAALAEAEHRKSVLLWFPETAADALSAGAYSLVKMLYAIGRRNVPDPSAKPEDDGRPVI